MSNETRMPRPRLTWPRRSATRGFTLVEMLIAMFIALIIFAIGFTILNGATQARQSAERRIETNADARAFFMLLERDLAGAYPGPGVWTPFTRNDLVKTASGVAGHVLEMPTTADTPTQGFEVLAVRYYVRDDNGRLYRETGFNDTSYPFAGPPDTSLALTEYVLLPEVTDMVVEYAQWDATGRKFLPATSATATHLDVKLKFLDPDPKLSITDRTRIFRKRIPIPSAFTN